MAETVTNRDVLEGFRTEIQAEHRLISDRISVHVFAQSALLTAYVIGWGYLTPESGEQLIGRFQFGIPILSALLSVVSFIGIYAGIRVQNDVISEQENFINDLKQTCTGEEAQRLLAFNRPTCCDRKTKRRFHILAMYPTLAIPMVFVLVWGILVFSLPSKLGIQNSGLGSQGLQSRTSPVIQGGGIPAN